MGVVQSAYGSTANGTSFTITLGSNITPGNTVVVVAVSEPEPTVTSVTGTDTFTKAVEDAASFTVIYYTLASAGGYETVTVHCSSSASAGGWAYEVTPCTQIDKTKSGSGASESFTSGATGTTSFASEFIIGGGAVLDDAGSITTITGPSSPWVNQPGQNPDTGDAVWAIAGYQVTAATGTFTYSGSANGFDPDLAAGVIATFKLAPAGSPAPPEFMPGPTWFEHFKPGMPKPRPLSPPPAQILPVHATGSMALAPMAMSDAGVLGANDLLEFRPGPGWFDHFKPGMRKPKAPAVQGNALPFNRTCSGSMALAPMSVSATGKSGTVSGTGSMALAPKAFSGTGHKGTVTHGSMALAPKAMLATDKETFAATGSLSLPALAMAGAGKNQPSVPPGPVKLLYELLVNGTWMDVTGYVYQRNNTAITRGKPDEGSQSTSNPSSMTLTVDNRDGRFSSKNPLSPYYPYLGRNTQLRVSAPASMPPPFDLVYRFWGEVSEWPPSWDPTGSDVYAQITVSGIFRRLTQSASLRSALYRYFSMQSPAPLAYWPCEDGSTATQLASGIPAGFPMRWNGQPSIGSDSGLPSSGAFPAMGDAIFTGDTGVSGALPVASFSVYSTAQSGHWTCPPNVTEALVTAVGGGAPGGGYNGSTGGGGGGGGEYAQDSVAVTPGHSYSFTVGSGSSGGNTTFTGDAATVTAHGGTAGDDSGNGGAGGTGSTNATHYSGGTGADGSGGPGGGGSETQQSAVFTSSSSWDADSTITGSVTCYVWGGGGGGGGGAGGGSPNGGGGGAGGNFNTGSVSVTGGNSYTVTVGNGGSGGFNANGGAGGASGFFGDFSSIQAHGGNGGAHLGGSGTPSSASEYTKGGYAGGGSNASPYRGGGGGGGAGLGGDGGNGYLNTPGGGGNSGGLDTGGGSGGNGGLSTNGDTGNAPGGGGGGSYTDAGSGGSGAAGRVELYWYDESPAPAAAVGGGGGSSGGSASAGNDGATEAGGAAVAGGGPGGGKLAGSTFTAAPVSGPGGGGGGYDSLGGPADGADGNLIISYAPSGGGGGGGVAANVLRFVLHVPSGGDTADGVVARMYTTGTISWIDLIYVSFTPMTLAATTVASTNPNPGPVNVTISGGTVTGISVNGVSTGLDAGTFEIPGSGTLTVTYSSAPTLATTGVAGTTGYLTLSGFSGAGATLFTTGQVQLALDGIYAEVSAELQTSGSNVTWNLTAIAAGGTEPIASGSGTLDGASLGDPWLLLMDPNQNMTSSFGHVLITENYYALTTDAPALAGYAGETAAARVTRLCGEQGITSSIVDTGDSDTTMVMGPQTTDKLVNLLQASEDADRGILYEPTGFFGVTYRSRASLYSQSQQITLDYSQGMLAQPLQPTEDDQLTRNDVTVTRLNGSSYEAVQSTGSMSVSDPPDGVGQYTYSLTADVQSDGQLPNLASWILWVGTQDDLRYPQISMDMMRPEITPQFDNVIGADLGDYLQIVNIPPWLPPDSIDQLVFGYTETLNTFVWTITTNNVPELPYEVAQAGTSRCNTDGSLLHTGIGTGDTTFTVDTPVPSQPWITSSAYSSQFPFNITVAPAGASTGEVMQVTAITSTTTPQMFTVVRGINGVVVPHSAGESVNVEQPAVAAL